MAFPIRRQRREQPTRTQIEGIADGLHKIARQQGIEFRLGEDRVVYQPGKRIKGVKVSSDVMALPISAAVDRRNVGRFYPVAKPGEEPIGKPGDPAELIRKAVQKTFDEHGVPVNASAPLGTGTLHILHFTPPKGLAEKIHAAYSKAQVKKKAA